MLLLSDQEVVSLQVVNSNYLLSMMTDSGLFVETTFTRPCLDLNLPCDIKS